MELDRVRIDEGVLPRTWTFNAKVSRIAKSKVQGPASTNTLIEHAREWVQCGLPPQHSMTMLKVRKWPSAGQRLYHCFVTTLNGLIVRTTAMASVGLFASLSSRALRRRSILTCRFSASSSAIFLAMRVVLSIGVPDLGTSGLNTVVFVSFANDHSPEWIHACMSELGISN